MQPIRLVTRGSPLALWQAEAVSAALMAAHPDLPQPEIVVVKTTGDRVRDRALSEVGGKGVFTKEIDRYVLEGDAEIAVHSMKDVETQLDPGIHLAAMLPRGDPRDAFLSPLAASVADLPQGALVGSASIRRKSQILRLRPDLEVVLFRGNVDTRLAKLAAGDVAATLLAAAGLKRLGRIAEATAILEPDEMLPAAGQGAVGITCRGDHAELPALLAGIDHRPTSIAVSCERAVLARLDGSCRTPVAAHAVIGDGAITLEAMVLSEDGACVAQTSRAGTVDQALVLGDDAGRELLAAAGTDLFGSRPV
jgi:hydroxymethylbilane synthase